MLEELIGNRLKCNWYKFFKLRWQTLSEVRGQQNVSCGRRLNLVPCLEDRKVFLFPRCGKILPQNGHPFVDFDFFFRLHKRFLALFSFFYGFNRCDVIFFKGSGVRSLCPKYIDWVTAVYFLIDVYGILTSLNRWVLPVWILCVRGGIGVTQSRPPLAQQADGTVQTTWIWTQRPSMRRGNNGTDWFTARGPWRLPWEPHTAFLIVHTESLPPPSLPDARYLSFFTPRCAISTFIRRIKRWPFNEVSTDPPSHTVNSRKHDAGVSMEYQCLYLLFFSFFFFYGLQLCLRGGKLSPRW